MKYLKKIKKFYSKQRHQIFVVFAILLGSLIGLAFVFTIYLYSSYQSVFVIANKKDDTPTVKGQPSATPTPTPDPNRAFGVLLLGYGGGGHAGGFLTDTIMLAYIEPKRERVTLITIPRDLWVPLQITENESKHFKINAAYAVGRDDKRYANKPIQYTGEAGGGEMAKDTLEMVTGLNIEYFGALSFAGFKKSIDTLDGVSPNVPVTFDDFYYPIEGEEENTCGFSESDIATASAELKGEKLEQFFSCRYEHLHFDAGPSPMDGETALKFVRSRHSSQHGGDASRTQRQRALIVSVKEKMFSIGFIPKLIPFISTLRSEFQTDIDLDRLSEFLNKADELRGYEIKSLPITEQNVLKFGTSSDRQSILMPRDGEDQWDGIKNYIYNELEGITPTPTPEPTEAVQEDSNDHSSL